MSIHHRLGLTTRALAALALVSCAHAEVTDPRYWLDRNGDVAWSGRSICLQAAGATDRDVTTFGEAATRINEVVGFGLIGHDCRRADVRILVGPPGDPAWAGQCHYTVGGDGRLSVAMVEVSSTAYASSHGSLAAQHELGHALGLAHDDRAGCVMYPVLYHGQVWCAEQVRELRAAYRGRITPLRFRNAR